MGTNPRKRTRNSRDGKGHGLTWTKLPKYGTGARGTQYVEELLTQKGLADAIAVTHNFRGLPPGLYNSIGGDKNYITEAGKRRRVIAAKNKLAKAQKSAAFATKIANTKIAKAQKSATLARNFANTHLAAWAKSNKRAKKFEATLALVEITARKRAERFTSRVPPLNMLVEYWRKRDIQREYIDAWHAVRRMLVELDEGFIVHATGSKKRALVLALTALKNAAEAFGAANPNNGGEHGDSVRPTRMQDSARPDVSVRVQGPQSRDVTGGHDDRR